MSEATATSEGRAASAGAVAELPDHERPAESIVPEGPWYSTLHRNPWVIAFVIGAVTLVLLRPFMRNVPDPPPVDFVLPAYQLMAENGEPWGSAELEGEVYVASFFFTSCPSICPALMSGMLSLQDRFERHEMDVKIVSITVDPENDTPAVLRTYGEKLGADFSRWTFLTGPPETVRGLVIDGFKLHVGDKKRDANNVVDIAHVGKVVLVDWEGGVRGFYDTDEAGLDEVFHRAQHVVHARDE